MASTSKVNNDIPVVGIDLGTTYSCLGIWRFGKVEIVANDFGYRITPSIVSFDDHVRLLGDAAKQQCYDNVENTVYDAKRLIGRTFDDPEVQKDMQNWPFTVRKGANGLPKIHVTFQGAKEILSPEEISSMILSKMKHIAEDFLGVPVKSAVITVPAYFNDQQRQATKDAAEIADLEVLRILNEPTAAALAYGFGNGLVMDKNILVFDLGGGTFDVSILNIKNTKFKVLATGGNTHLGGEDFDNCMVNHFLTEINRKMHKDIRGNKRALVKLRRACELAKRTLSLQTMATLHVELLVDGIDFRSTITRARFEELCNELFRSTLIIVVDALKGAKMVKSQIDEIVMVGGSTRIPKIQNLVKNFFEGKEPTKSINPDEAVAYGACLAAAILHGAGPNRELSMDLTDVLPLSLGVGCEKDFGEMGFVLARNTEIPVSHSEIFMTLEDNQTEINFKVFQGEHNLTKSNILLGEFELRNIPKNRAEEEKAIVTFTVNANGILNVTAQLMSTKKSAQIVVDTKGKLSKKEIEQMVLNAQMMNEKDRERKSLDQSKNKLEQLCWNLKEVFSDESNTSDIPATELTYILQKCDVTLNWLQSNAQFSDNEAITQQTSKMNALVDRWLPNVGDSFSQTH